jgi:hypothetical protein
MIILQINVVRVFTLKRESQPPVATDCDAPCAFARSLQLVQAIARQVHIYWGRSTIQIVQLPDEPPDEIGGDASGFSGFKKLFKSFVAETFNHEDLLHVV